MRRKKVATRAYKILQTILVMCETSKPGLVSFGPLKKLVRIDYLEKSVKELCVDECTRNSLFYRNRPVNLKKWLLALCQYDIARFTPRKWFAARLIMSVEPHVQAKEHLADISLLAYDSQHDDFINALKTLLRHEGITLRVYGTFEQHEQSVSFWKNKRTVAFDISNVETMVLSGCRVDLNAAENRPILFRPGDVIDLPTEEILGTLYRNSADRSVFCLGAGSNTLALYLLDGTSTLLKQYTRAHAMLGKIRRETADVDRVAWLARLSFSPEQALMKTRGETYQVRVTFQPFVSSKCAHHLKLMGGNVFNAFSQAAVTQIAKLVRKTLEAAKTKNDTAKKHSVAEIMQHVVRAQAPPLETSARATDDALPSERPTPKDFVPTECRDAWVLPSGAEIFATDDELKLKMRNKRRCFWAQRCRKCPPDAAEPRKTELMPCANKLCTALFVYYSTSSHYCYRDHTRSLVEKDMNLPLFCDEVLQRVP